MTGPEGGAFAGKVAVVTGASRGIGAAAAQRLAAEGAAVALVARTVSPGGHRLPGSLEETCARISGSGGQSIIVPADLSSVEFDAAAVVAGASNVLGPVDVLINNAGLASAKSLARATSRDWELSLRINVLSPLALALAAMQSMAGRGGAIVNITSFMAQLPGSPLWDPLGPTTFGGVYGATKAALNRWTASLAAEVTAEGIVVNAVAPHASVATQGALLSAGVDEERTEPVETIVEAIVALSLPGTAGGSGNVWSSLDLLTELARPVCTLDGKSLLAGWQPGEFPGPLFRREPPAAG